ncbi:uncharacterized protein LOC131876503 [Cryptomeria japonica]|uniref:uncharacterized protein LOC131876503 n=1 Tax=Cryptomeria japonica TaxID=3369 RepID=UPI0027D9E1F4|nr:uncharacterized protein LOC131876503 [Cryptomeria japonica]
MGNDSSADEQEDRELVLGKDKLIELVAKEDSLVAKLAEPELQDLNLEEFDYAREFYDPYRKLKQAMPKAYEGHKPRLEDFGANLQDNFEVVGEGSQEKEEVIEINEDVPTQPPPTNIVNIPVTNAPVPPLLNVTKGKLGIQGFMSSTKEVIIRNVESDSYQEEDQPEQHRPLGEEKEQDEAKDLLNERLVLTPQDQEDLFKDIAIQKGGTKVEEDEEITFNEAVNNKLGELHKKQHLNTNISLQMNLAHQVTSPHDLEETNPEERDEAKEQAEVHIVIADIVSHQGDKDQDIPHWLEFTFEKKNRKEDLPKVTLQKLEIQGFRSNTEEVIIINVELDLDQEEDQPKKHRPLGEEKEQDEAEDLLNERLVLTPQDQEDFKEIVVEEGGTEAEVDEEIKFNEVVSDKLGYLHKQKQRNTNISLQTNLAHPVASPHDLEETNAKERDEAEEQA